MWIITLRICTALFHGYVCPIIIGLDESSSLLWESVADIVPKLLREIMLSWSPLGVTNQPIFSKHFREHLHLIKPYPKNFLRYEQQEYGALMLVFIPHNLEAIPPVLFVPPSTVYMSYYIRWLIFISSIVTWYLRDILISSYLQSEGCCVHVLLLPLFIQPSAYLLL